MKKRKVIQIEVDPGEAVTTVLYALCDDGSIFWKNTDKGLDWHCEDLSDLETREI